MRSVFEREQSHPQADHHLMMWRKADVIEWLRMAASMARAELDACAQPRNIARLRELLTDTDRMLRELQSVHESALRQPVMEHDETSLGSYNHGSGRV